VKTADRALLKSFCVALLIMLAGLAAFPQANVQGKWSTLPYTMPINPIHAVLLHDGTVLVIAGSGNYPPITNFQAAVWDPQTGNISTQSVGWDMFCNGAIVLADGRPFVNGGTAQYNPFYGSPNSSVFDPGTSQFADLIPMADGRWYPTVTELPDGTILTFSGTTLTGGTNSRVEIFSPFTWSWSPPYAAGWTPPLYPRLHVLPNGNVFYSGPGYQSRYYYPATHKWSKIIATANYASKRTYGSSVLLPLTPANNYKPVVMIMGGHNPATATTELIDLSASTPTWQWGPNMSQPRIEMNAVILPNGKVLALGGSASDEKATTASYNADLYDPSTNTFSSAGKNAYPRLYHSVALLLPDATVWLAGSNPTRGTYDPRMELYQPAYLFDSSGNLAARPAITSAPSIVNYSQSFNVGTPNAANIQSVVLVRAGAVTHAFDMDQRMVSLLYTAGSGSLSVTAPPNANIAPPGYYLLFLLNSSGVPSVATFVQLTAGPDFSVTPSPAQRVIVLGQNTSYNLQAYPSGGFGGTVNLGVTGVPSGATASLTSSSVAAGGSSVLNVNTSGLNPATLPQSYTMKVTGTSGALTRSADLQLLVNSPGDFSISASPSTLTITRGTSGNVVVTLAPSGGFVGVTNFTVVGLPSRVTASFSPASVKGSGTTTLTLTAASNAPLVTRKITITGTSGTLIHSTSVTLTIQ
jgi:galactose oxidase-like protein